MGQEQLFAHELFRLGPLVIRDTVVTTWLLMLGSGSPAGTWWWRGRGPSLGCYRPQSRASC
jgi:hypothetical protein